MHRSTTPIRSSPRRAAFTLIELLVVMGVIVILIGLTVVAVAAVARGSQLSTATNRVKGALGQARALAMRESKPVLAVFRAAEEGEEGQVIEIIIAEAAESGRAVVPAFGVQVVDRFVPVNGVDPVRLPDRIKVAGPGYSANADALWHTQSELARVLSFGETPGRVFGVMFGADGSLLTQNPYSDSNRIYVDFNRNAFQDVMGTSYDYAQLPPPNVADADFQTNLFQQRDFEDENYVEMIPFLAVYDDAECREFFDPSDWNDPLMWEADVSQYVDQFAKRIHFNRYTGVAMK
jgi:type II secretory pathway pseudopilin PulG